VWDGYLAAGWAGKLHTVRASSHRQAIERLHRRLYPQDGPGTFV
jgi:hypothetical protein